MDNFYIYNRGYYYPYCYKMISINSVLTKRIEKSSLMLFNENYQNSIKNWGNTSKEVISKKQIQN